MEPKNVPTPVVHLSNLPAFQHERTRQPMPRRTPKTSIRNTASLDVDEPSVFRMAFVAPRRQRRTCNTQNTACSWVNFFSWQRYVRFQCHTKLPFVLNLGLDSRVRTTFTCSLTCLLNANNGTGLPCLIQRSRHLPV